MFCTDWLITHFGTHLISTFKTLFIAPSQLEQEIARLEKILELPLMHKKVTEELLSLLPESQVDDTPTILRRRKQELSRYKCKACCNLARYGVQGGDLEIPHTHQA